MVERRQRKSGAGGSSTRDRIMAVAEAHLGQGGYLGVSLEEVAREVGVSKPALYYHFPDGKEELFVAIAHRALDQHREGLERAISSARDGAARLRAIARWMMSERAREHPMAELRHVGDFMKERHRAELADAFLRLYFRPDPPRHLIGRRVRRVPPERPRVSHLGLPEPPLRHARGRGCPGRGASAGGDQEPTRNGRRDSRSLS